MLKRRRRTRIDTNDPALSSLRELLPGSEIRFEPQLVATCGYPSEKGLPEHARCVILRPHFLCQASLVESGEGKYSMQSEADTCRRRITPKLQAGGWDTPARCADAGQHQFHLSASTGEWAGVPCRKLHLAERGIDLAPVPSQ